MSNSLKKHLSRYRICVVFCAIIALIFPRVAIANDITQQTIDICLHSHLADEEFIGHISDLGWLEKLPKDLGDEDVVALAIHTIMRSMADMDAPAVRWTHQWQLALKAASGTRRLETIYGAPNKRYFFGHEEMTGLLEISVLTHPAFVLRGCILTVTSESAPITLHSVMSEEISEDDPPFVFGRRKQFAVSPYSKTTQTIYFNPYKLPELIGFDVPFIGMVWASNSLTR